MAKDKKRKVTQAGGEPPRRRKSSGGGGMMGRLLYAGAGAASGAAAQAALVVAGDVKPTNAAMMVGAAGVAGAVALKGKGRDFCLGVTASAVASGAGAYVAEKVENAITGAGKDTPAQPQLDDPGIAPRNALPERRAADRELDTARARENAPQGNGRLRGM